ncbi:MAG TPA: GRP family sugar transporter [Thermoanaerobaculia bacterium]|nr:GRP family sugar transporter [Thermoanaerobaculia bacterium]
MTILSTICWGSFANTFKLTKNYRFELYYWDYAAGIFLISVILALTMGSTRGGDTTFVTNLHDAATLNIVWAAIGGFIFNIANVLLIAGIEIVGLAIAFPISIGIALVEGVVLSYALQPKGNAGLLGAGVVMAVLAVILIGLAYGQLQGGNRSVSRKGVVVCIVSGFLMGTFAPFVTRAMTAAHPLSPYTVAVFFTLGAVICCFVFNTYLMKRPLVGEPVGFGGYIAAPGSYHALGLLGGAIWGVGTVFNFVAASLVGVAISYAIGQASPMIAALWGVFVWREFRGSNTKAKLYLVGMFVAYVLALVLIARAYQAG